MLKVCFKAVSIKDTDNRCIHEHLTVHGAIKCCRRLDFEGIACFDPHLHYIRTLSGRFIYRRRN